MKKYLYSAVAIASTPLFAQLDPGLPKVDKGLKPEWGDMEPIDAIQMFVQGLLGLLGIIMVIVCLYGGWKILSSGSEDEGKEAGKKIITNAVIGIVVIFFAWTITSFIFDMLGSPGVTN